MLASIFTASAESITYGEILICTGVSLALGLVIAFVYMYRNRYTKNFVLTVALLPVLVQSVIMLVNGNLGAGVAVMGAFGLVRFRSAPGNAREISSIFFAMAIGLATGMGYVTYAVMFTFIVSAVIILYVSLKFGEKGGSAKSLRITIPEDVDYTTIFDDLFDQYTKTHSLEKIKTTNLGSLFELQYVVTLKNPADEKKFLDKLRTRNGNLNIVCGQVVADRDEL